MERLHEYKIIQKMARHNQQLYFDILENPLSYSKNFIKNTGLSFMEGEEKNGEFVQPIVDLYRVLIK